MNRAWFRKEKLIQTRNLFWRTRVFCPKKRLKRKKTQCLRSRPTRAKTRVFFKENSWIKASWSSITRRITKVSKGSIASLRMKTKGFPTPSQMRNKEQISLFSSPYPNHLSANLVSNLKTINFFLIKATFIGKEWDFWGIKSKSLKTCTGLTNMMTFTKLSVRLQKWPRKQKHSVLCTVSLTFLTKILPIPRFPSTIGGKKGN